MPTDKTIAELHSAYCKATGFDLPMRMGRDRVWFDFEKAGFTVDDLQLVIRWIRQQAGIRGSGYTISSLRFSTLLQLDYFEEKLLLARQAFGRRPRQPATVLAEQRVGEISRQIEVPAPSGEAVPAGAVGAQLLRQWRERAAGPASDFQPPAVGTEGKDRP
jgi:hypothetical protein